MALDPNQLSVDQKVALLAGADTWHTTSFEEPPVPAIRMSDGPAGARGTSWTGAASASFPCGAALGATFDPELVREVGRALGREARSKSAHVLLGPTINLQRTPIGGRNFEFFSEDPVLTSELAVAYVEGVQAERVAACVKHFIGNDTEFERMSISSEIDERTLREVYLPPFEAAVRRAGARVVMSGYNKLNGTFCAEHRWLLTEVLRDEWGFDGVVTSDWFGCHSAVESVLAGCDIEMPGPPLQRGEHLRAAFDRGEVTEDDLERSVARLLALAEWAGAADTGTAEVTADDPETRAVIRRTAVRAAVLLKNDDATLPLAATTRTIALIGPYGRYGRVQGGGSARVTPAHLVGPLDALRERGYDVTFEPGGSIARYLPAMRGDFTVEFSDDGGTASTSPVTALSWFWDQPPAAGLAKGFTARITGTFTPESSGTWEIGVRAIGTAAVRLDGEVVVEISEAQTGGAFFGLGSQEVRAQVELEADRPYALAVEHPGDVAMLVRGLAVTARAVPAADQLDRAVAAARSADVAVVLVGTDDEWETEGEDRTSMQLPGEQDELVAAVVAANPNTVVVLNTGSPVTMPWLDAVPAVLQLWFPGQAIGDALADVLVGDEEPAGRLPLTFPARLEHTPAATTYGHSGKVAYDERLLVGHRWYDAQGIEPLFPFGHGLGYSTFTIEPGAIAGSPHDGVEVGVTITNTGPRRGSEVVQAYVEGPEGEVGRPIRQLGAFRRVDLDPGEERRVTIAVPARAFASWVDGAWSVAAGDHHIVVGRSSRDLTPVGSLRA